MINKDSSQEPTGIKQTFVTKSLVCFITAREYLKNNIGFLKKKNANIDYKYNLFSVCMLEFLFYVKFCAQVILVYN